MVINPPYGRRLGTPAESRRLFRDICRRLASEYNAWKIILIPPPGFPLRMIPFGLTPHRVRHGGLMVDLLVGRIGEKGGVLMRSLKECGTVLSLAAILVPLRPGARPHR